MALEDALRALCLDLGERLGDAFVEKAQGFSPRRTGALADSIVADGASDNGSSVTNHVSVGEEYGIYQEEGTGVYGPRGQRIQGSPLLAFDWPAAGGVVIVHSVAGTSPTHFWQRTIDQWPSIVASVA